MNISYSMARKAFANGKPVYAEFHEVVQRRERVTGMVDHGDEVSLKFFNGSRRMAKNRIQFIA